MLIVQYLAIAAILYCVCSLLVHFVRIVRLGKPNDLSEKSGDTGKGILYANTVAMMPTQKESAYLHIPSYVTGMLFHVGTFSSILILFLSFFDFFNGWISGPDRIHLIIALIMAVTCLNGYALLLKRAFSKDLRPMSNPDDYISNALTSTFQLVTALYLCCPCKVMVTIYYMVSIILLLYLPLGKLRHLLYYFSARYHLGFFYGWRNVWPNKEK